MGMIRRRKHTQTQRVTSAAVAAFRSGDATQLHRELRLRPWQASPLAVVGDCPWPAGKAGANTWADSVALRAELTSQVDA